MEEYNKRSLDLISRAISELERLKKQVIEYDIDIVELSITKPVYVEELPIVNRHIELDIEFVHLNKELI